MPVSRRDRLYGAAAEARELLGLAIPVVVSMASATLIGVVDTVMLAPLGTATLAATSLTASVLLVCYAGLYGLLSVTGVIAAHAQGAQDAGALSVVLKAGLVLAGACGALAALAMVLARPGLVLLDQPVAVLELVPAYWVTMALGLIPFALFHALKGVYEAIDRAWLGVAVAFVGVAVNVPANWLLIHGYGDWEGLGLLGAGLGSVIAQTVSFLVLIGHWRLAPSMEAVRGEARLRWEQVREQLREGAPVAAGYMGETVAYSAAGLMLGWFGTEALAANQIVQSVGSVLYMLPLGMAVAVSLRVGQASGAGRLDRVRRIGVVAIGITSLWMAIVAACLVLAGESVAASLSEDGDVASLAATMFVVVASMQVFDGVQATALGALRGVLDTRWPVMVTIAAYWAIGLPAAWLLSGPWGAGPVGVWAGYGIGLVVAALTLSARFARRSRPT